MYITVTATRNFIFFGVTYDMAINDFFIMQKFIICQAKLLFILL